ncbi:MAG: 6-phosphogluconolactonase [Sedimentisphaeraceae bacterium JB056]
MSFDWRDIVLASKEAIRLRGRFVVALSGGSSMVSFGRALCELSCGIEWDKWHFFFADERCVPLSDHRSNYYLAKRELFDIVGVENANIHAVDDSLDPHAAATDYQAQIEFFFDTQTPQVPVFDLVVLGIGTDGHTASLFPNSKLLEEKQRLVAEELHSPKPPSERVTFTLPLINAAGNILFIATGESKRDIIKKITTTKTPDKSTPATMIKPKDGALNWLLNQ